MKKRFVFLFCVILLHPLAVALSDDSNTSAQIAILKSQADHKLKWQAKDNLSKIGKDAVLPLIGLLEDQTANENAAYYAIRALGEIQDERAVAPLAKILLDQHTRYAAIALGRIKSPSAIPALKQALDDENEYVIEDAITALQYIDPSQGQLYLEKLLSNQVPNGLEVSLSASKIFDNITFKLVFKNINSFDISIEWVEIYQSLPLIAQENSGKVNEGKETSEYGYTAGPETFHLIKAGGTFEVEFKGKVKVISPAEFSVLHNYDWDFADPKETIKILEFKDSILILSSASNKTSKLKFYFVYKQGEREKYWGDKFGFQNIWTGKVVSSAVDLDL